MASCSLTEYSALESKRIISFYPQMRMLRSLCFAFFTFFIVSCSHPELYDREERIIFIPLVYNESLPVVVTGLSLWMNQVEAYESNQGADCFRNYVCQFRVDHTALDIMDMKEKTHVATIRLPSLSNSYHCNNADFGNSFFSDEDEFPLLYSSHQGIDARCILVDRIIHEGDEYQLETVQRIGIPWEEDKPLCYTPDAIIDKEHNYLYVYTGNTRPITSFYIYRFRLPSPTEGDVRLTRNDLLASWVIRDNPSYYKQGGLIKNGVLYIMEGVPGWQTPSILRIIDLEDCSYKLINLSNTFHSNWEPEDIFVYDDHFFIASNRVGIYMIDIEKRNSEQE